MTVRAFAVARLGLLHGLHGLAGLALCGLECLLLARVHVRLQKVHEMRVLPGAAALTARCHLALTFQRIAVAIAQLLPFQLYFFYCNIIVMLLVRAKKDVGIFINKFTAVCHKV